ncbi:M20/M25/M40 family metallo-hydrolase [bacterium]|nr:M20/M25/M40 family metallo-hydrolase [bacterium]
MLESRLTRRVGVLSLAFVLGASLARQGVAEDTSEAARIVAIAEQDNQVMEHLEHLTKKIGPRLTSSSNLKRAYEWTRERFESFGLKNAHTEVWGKFDVGFDRGPSSGKIITDEGEKKITVGTFAWTAGTDGPVRGPVLFEPRTSADLEKVKDKLKGAWLLTRRSNKPVPKAEREQVQAAVQAAGIAGRVRGWGELILTDGSPEGIKIDALPKDVHANVTGEAWKIMSDAVKAGTRCELELDVKNVFLPGPIENKNVIADIPGVEKPDELVIVGGHLDSWDGAEGATDNGTGVATTLEAARLLAKAGVKPRRTIRFILWSGEEQGLLGSVGYVRAHKDELPRISCVLVHDGGTNYVSGLAYTKAMKPLLDPALEPLKKLDAKMPFKPRTVRQLIFGIGSDHDTFLGSGVPGFFWDQAGEVDYNHTHHTQFDTFDQAVPEYQKHSAVTIALGALAIANLDSLLPRDGLPKPRKMLGVQTDNDLTIVGVVPDSLAEKAGLQAGDRILKLGGKNLATLEDLRDAVRTAQGDTELVYSRDGADKTAIVPFPKEKRWL